MVCSEPGNLAKIAATWKAVFRGNKSKHDLYEYYINNVGYRVQKKQELVPFNVKR